MTSAFEGRAGCVLLAVAIGVSCTSATEPLPPVPTVEEAGRLAHGRETADAFFDTLRPWVGDSPVECNTNLNRREFPPSAGIEIDRTPWFECAAAARAAGRTFVILVEEASPDSYAWTGVLGTVDRRFLAFSYDSDPSGGGRSVPTLAIGDCVSPQPQIGRGHHGVRCANAMDGHPVSMTRVR